MSKSKIVLTTLHSANIGNRLQNFALQSVLRNMGCEVYTPTYDDPKYDTGIKKIKLYIKLCLAYIGIDKFRYQIYICQREKEYLEFSKRHISNLFKISFDKINEIDWNQFDYAVTGSDQVWHRWSDNQNELRYFYLQFMPKEKRISYAPSFGFEEFSETDKQIHIEGIKGMRYLSAREISGKALMESVADNPVELVLDPTLLLNAENWRSLAQRPTYDCPENKYVLIYMLGQKSKEYTLYIEAVAKERNLQIIDVLDEGNKEHYMTTPDEFVWLVEHANCILTDSFHACVFSIIFHKEFLAFRRQGIGFEKMFGRIETLFENCGITGHVYENKDTELNSDVNWDMVDKNILEKQELSKRYLSEALERS